MLGQPVAEVRRGPHADLRPHRQSAPDGLAVKGVSFHVGSQNENQLKYIEALEYCRDICRKPRCRASARNHRHRRRFSINYLTNVAPIQQFCQPINEYLERYFSNYRIIAEPGRFISGPSMVLATRVMGKSMRSGVWWYYLDEGVYGAFSGKIYDHADYPLFTSRAGPTFNSVLAGPTCDSIDVLYENIALPELMIGTCFYSSPWVRIPRRARATSTGFRRPRSFVLIKGRAGNYINK